QGRSESRGETGAQRLEVNRARAQRASEGSALEPADAEAELDGVDPRVGRREARVGNVHVADFHAPMEALAENVHSQRRAGSEIHLRGSGGNLVIGEQSSATELEVGHDPATSFEVPLQIHRIDAGPKRAVAALDQQESRGSVHGILKGAAQEARAVRAGEYPAVAQANVPHAGIGSASRGAAPAAGPKLNFVRATFRAP